MGEVYPSVGTRISAGDSDAAQLDLESSPAVVKEFPGDLLPILPPTVTIAPNIWFVLSKDISRLPKV